MTGTLSCNVVAAEPVASESPGWMQVGNDNLCVQAGITADTVDGDAGSNLMFGAATRKAHVTMINNLSQCFAGQ